jgi:hypothetical protein
MNVTEKTLQENYIYFLRELSRINEEIETLPPGSITIKKIRNRDYYYHQWRAGKKVKSISLGKKPSPDLMEGIRRRQTLEERRREILANISVISRAIDIQRATVDEIVKAFSQSGIETVLMGSYVLPVIKEDLGFHLPTIRTQDVDFLVKAPYRGKAITIDSILRTLGFTKGFNRDGSTYFSNGMFRVEFFTPQKGRGSQDAVAIKSLKIKATPLRYVQMLLDQQMEIKREGYSFRVSRPWVFAFHKILISKRRLQGDKREKDMLQARALLVEIVKRPDMAGQARAYLESLPAGWKKEIRLFLDEQGIKLA